jgi:TonB family protein
MRNAKRAIQSLACALALLANGAAAASAQQQPPREKQPADVLVERDRIMIKTEQGDPAGAMHGGIVVGGQGEGGAISFTWVASEMSFDSRVVKGAPFSAEAVSETTQTLADGNRISHKRTTAIYRDSEGRTRRDETATAVGPFAPAGEAHKTIFINDPVSGVNYVLNPRTNTAMKMAQHFMFERRGPNGPQGGGYTFEMRTGEPGQRQPDTSKPILAGTLNGRALKGPQPVYPAVARAAGAQGRVTVEVVVSEEGKVESAKALDGHPLLRQAAVDAASQWEFAPTKLSNQPVKVTGRISFNFMMTKGYEGAAAGAPPPPPAPGEAPAPMGALMHMPAPPPRFEESKETLGRQSVEGVEAEGTRTTTTIPAGAIGNERPILIVSERWYSPELQLVVMTRHSDPRFGETTYRLTNVSRGEPDRALFEVPAGYTIKEGGGPIERRIETLPMRRPSNEQ